MFNYKSRLPIDKNFLYIFEERIYNSCDLFNNKKSFDKRETKAKMVVKQQNEYVISPNMVIYSCLAMERIIY